MVTRFICWSCSYARAILILYLLHSHRSFVRQRNFRWASASAANWRTAQWPRHVSPAAFPLGWSPRRCRSICKHIHIWWATAASLVFFRIHTSKTLRRFRPVRNCSRCWNCSWTRSVWGLILIRTNRKINPWPTTTNYDQLLYSIIIR